MKDWQNGKCDSNSAILSLRFLKDKLGKLRFFFGGGMFGIVATLPIMITMRDGL